MLYLYIVKISIDRAGPIVKRNLYGVKIVTYKGGMAKKIIDDRASRAGSAKSRGPAKAVAGKSRRRDGAGRPTICLTIMATCAAPCSRRPKGCSNATGWRD